MGALICAGITSLDGYIADERGDFSWGRPDSELHSFVNELERPVGTYLYGRRMYEVMRFWQTADTEHELPDAEREYAGIWQDTDKVVYSSTLTEVQTPRTRLERTFDADAVRRMKSEADRDLSVSGPHLAEHAFRAGLVDEVHLFVHPVAVGGGTALLPRGIRLDLELRDERRFATGVVYLRYGVLEAR